jgi:hypothetical protein
LHNEGELISRCPDNVFHNLLPATYYRYSLGYVWQPCELVSFLAYLEPVKIKLNKHYIYSNFSKFKKISTVANDNLEKVKTIY